MILRTGGRGRKADNGPSRISQQVMRRSLRIVEIILWRYIINCEAER